MQRLSKISVAVLLAIGCVIAGAVFIHPQSAAPSHASSPTSQGTPPTTQPASSNGTLLTQPPAAQTGDDGGGGTDD